MTATNNLSSGQVTSAPSLTDSPYAVTSVDTAMLVQMLKSKSERGFLLLYDKYSGALYSILIKLVRRTDVADDLLQDIFLKIWKYIDGFDPARGTLFTWMLNITRNHAIDYLRSSGYRQQMQEVNIDFSSLHIETIGVTDSTAGELEFKDIKSKALDLDPKYAEVIDMIFFNGWTYEQTAQILNQPLGTVKTRARKGLSMLKSMSGIFSS